MGATPGGTGCRLGTLIHASPTPWLAELGSQIPKTGLPSSSSLKPQGTEPSRPEAGPVPWEHCQKDMQSRLTMGRGSCRVTWAQACCGHYSPSALGPTYHPGRRKRTQEATARACPLYISARPVLSICPHIYLCVSTEGERGTCKNPKYNSNCGHPQYCQSRCHHPWHAGLWPPLLTGWQGAQLALLLGPLGDSGVLGFGGLRARQQGDGGVVCVVISLGEVGALPQLEEHGQVAAPHVHGAWVH